MFNRPALGIPLPLPLRYHNASPHARHKAKQPERRVPAILVLLSFFILVSLLLSPVRLALQALLLPFTTGHSTRFCDVAPCVFDVGHNSGQDTQDYLTTGPSNLRVVAVDANPVLISRSTVRFADALRTSRLQLVNVGLVETTAPSATASKASSSTTIAKTPGGNLTFWINEKNDKFSSFAEHLGCRNGWGVETKAGSADRKCHPMSIPTRTCAQLLRQFGTPVYLKIDIEGMDLVCLRTLKELGVAERPTYVSIENVWKGGINALVKLGYTRFKVVNQLNVSLGRPRELEGASGPWGEQAVDCQTGFNWSSEKEIFQRMGSLPKRMLHDKKDMLIWYDLHGKMTGR